MRGKLQMKNNVIIQVETSKCDEIYAQLKVEMYKAEDEINYHKLMFLTGAVQGLRLVGYQVEEIELACILIKKHLGGVELW